MTTKLLITLLFLMQTLFVFGQSNGPKPPKGYCSKTMIKIAHTLGFLELVDKKPKVPVEITKYEDIIYRIANNDTLRLDIYQNKDIKQSAPLLVFIHGGSWRGGDKDDYRRYLVDFAQKGYITATISYRLSDQAVFPAAVSDVKCAVSWLKANANKYFIDSNRIALVGGSAGGHLAMMVGYSDNDDDKINSSVNAVVNIYGPSDLTCKIAIESDAVQKFLGKDYSEAPELYKKASPLTYLTKDDPPTLIFHGTIDKVVPVEQSDNLKVALDRVGITTEYHRLNGWPHTMDLGLEVNRYCQYYMNSFFEKHLK